MKQKTVNIHKKFFLKFFFIGVFVIGIVCGVVYLSFQLSPWPSALLIRMEFEKNAAATSQSLEKYVPSGITSISNQQYRLHDSDAYLDVYYPASSTKALPTIVWIHGGAWISGNKDQNANYLKLLASKGFTTVSVGYSIAPAHHFPLPLKQVNDALFYLQNNAERFHSDPNQVILAGDSAGAQIAAQMATVITNPEYAYRIGVPPSVAQEKIKGVVLACGAYDLALVDLQGPYSNFLRTVLWAYSGEKDFMDDPKFQLLSIINYVTNEYPPTFITVGNADPLESQSFAFAQKLQKEGVKTQTLFYPADHQPKLPHEYQFNLATEDGEKALTEIISFIMKVSQ